MFGNALTIGKIRGIEVRVHISWLAIAALVMWSFWSRFRVLRDYDTPSSLAMAVAAAALFFGSILAHELAHALEARHRGLKVAGITLFLFGGVSETKSEAERPKDEFALTAVGPYTSFVLAAAFGLLATGAGEAGLESVADVAGLIGWLNFALGVFNLLPGAPLDGGRILRSIVWRVTGDRRKAMRAATLSGRVIGALILGLGLFQLFFVPGAFVGGLWFAFIGWFLMQAAVMEQLQAGLKDLVEGVAVRRLLPDAPHPLPAGASAQDAARTFLRLDAEHLPVSDDGDVVGVVPLDSVKRIPPEERELTPVSELMRPVASLPSIDIDDEVSGALERLDDGDGLVAVKEGDEVVGLLTARNLLGAVQRMKDLNPAGEPVSANSGRR